MKIMSLLVIAMLSGTYANAGAMPGEVLSCTMGQKGSFKLIDTMAVNIKEGYFTFKGKSASPVVFTCLPTMHLTPRNTNIVYTCKESTGNDGYTFSIESGGIVGRDTGYLDQKVNGQDVRIDDLICGK